MKAFIITMKDNPDSVKLSQRCIQSIEETKMPVDVHVSNAVVPKTLPDTLHSYFRNSEIPNIYYTYPKTPEENRHDLRSGLQLSAYPTADLDKRVSCLMSHYVLWQYAIQNDETIMILEHDAIFSRMFDPNIEFSGSILGLNDPRGATRRSNVFHDKVKEPIPLDKIVKPVAKDIPWIDDKLVPQGLAGNSAYIMKPKGARMLCELIAEHGLWPNDAIMCKQLMPGQLKTLYPYVTYVKQERSFTSE
jgi:GR25 family glycosyltransferase involved in LPS biosynthesis